MEVAGHHDYVIAYYCETTGEMSKDLVGGEVGAETENLMWKGREAYPHMVNIWDCLADFSIYEYTLCLSCSNRPTTL